MRELPEDKHSPPYDLILEDLAKRPDSEPETAALKVVFEQYCQGTLDEGALAYRSGVVVGTYHRKKDTGLSPADAAHSTLADRTDFLFKVADSKEGVSESYVKAVTDVFDTLIQGYQRKMAPAEVKNLHGVVLSLKDKQPYVAFVESFDSLLKSIQELSRPPEKDEKNDRVSVSVGKSSHRSSNR